MLRRSRTRDTRHVIEETREQAEWTGQERKLLQRPEDLVVGRNWDKKSSGLSRDDEQGKEEKMKVREREKWEGWTSLSKAAMPGQQRKENVEQELAAIAEQAGYADEDGRGEVVSEDTGCGYCMRGKRDVAGKRQREEKE